VNLLKEWWQTWLQDRLLQKVIRNTGYLFSSNTINMLLSIIQSSFAAHLLGVRMLGVLGTITVFASTINRLFSFRMGELVVKYIGDDLENNQLDRAAAIFKASALIEAVSSIFAFIILVLLAPYAARYLADDPETTSWFILYGLIILGNAVTETSTGVLHLDNQFRNQAAINVTQGVLTAAIITWAFLTERGMHTVLLAYLLGKMILGMGPMILAFRSLERIFGKKWWKASFSLLPPWRELLRFGMGTNLSATINLVVRDSELLWVAYFLSPVEAGYFKIAVALNNLVLMPITPFISTTYPEINRSVVSQKWLQLRGLLRRVSIFSGGWTIAAAAGLVILGKWIIPIYAGPEYLPAYPAMLVLLLGYGMANILFWNRALLLAFNLPVFAFKAMLAAGVLKTALAFIVVPRFGYVAEAALLSAFFILSVGAIALRGLKELRQHEGTLPDEGQPA
jgi:O-antigen/teichoic acid export membrane protein